MVVRLDRVGEPAVGDTGAGGHLDRFELSRIHVIFDLGIGLNGTLGASRKAQAPACHVVALAHGVQFNRHILATRASQDGERFLVIGQRRVGGVLYNQNVVLVGKRDEGVEDRLGRGRPGRVIGVVHIEQLGFFRDVGRNGIEIGMKPVFFEQR